MENDVTIGALFYTRREAANIHYVGVVTEFIGGGLVSIVWWKNGTYHGKYSSVINNLNATFGIQHIGHIELHHGDHDPLLTVVHDLG